MTNRLLAPICVLAATTLWGAAITAAKVDPQKVDTSDFTQAVESTAEAHAEFSTGTQPESRGIAVYVWIDARGLTVPALRKIRGALDCNLDPVPTKLDRIVCKIGQTSLFGWRKSATSNEYAAYVIADHDTFLKLKQYALQDPRIAIYQTWGAFRKSGKCGKFFRAAPHTNTIAPCTSASPPGRFYGVGQ